MKQTDHYVVGDGGYEVGKADQEHNRLSTRFDENASWSRNLPALWYIYYYN